MYWEGCPFCCSGPISSGLESSICYLGRVELLRKERRSGWIVKRMFYGRRRRGANKISKNRGGEASEDDVHDM